MRLLGPTAALVALTLLTASCNPGPQPSDGAPPSRPAVETEPTPDPTVDADQPGAGQTDATSTKKKSPPSTGVRVLGAIGKAVRNSVTGDSQK